MLKDRRAYGRYSVNYPMTVELRPNFAQAVRCVSVSEEGLAYEGATAECKVGARVTLRYLEFEHRGKIVWIDDSQNRVGVSCEQNSEFLKKLLSSSPALQSDRRSKMRRKAAAHPEAERRKVDRRFSALIDELLDGTAQSQRALKTLFKKKSTDSSLESMRERREFLKQAFHTEFSHIDFFNEPADQFVGKVENAIGVAHVPIGVAGPLQINGSHAKGSYFVPMATTEGALITSYTLGSHIITRSGGANVRVIRDELRISSMFVFSTLKESSVFDSWLKRHESQIKKIAEATSHHIELNKISTVLNGRRVLVNFHYHTKDAMGMNMACKASDAATKYMRAIVKPEECWLRANYNSNKKVTANNFINGYGKTVTADVVIPKRLIGLFNATPAMMQQYFFRTLLSDAHAVMIGANGHFANAIAAVFIATGQDVASVANSHVGISTCEVNPDGDLYFSVYLSNLLIGTVGGGTHFGTAQDCLNLIGCLGKGKALKFAEIIAALVLAGEISICASIVNGTYVYAHETFGRNRPSSAK